MLWPELPLPELVRTSPPPVPVPTCAELLEPAFTEVICVTAPAAPEGLGCGVEAERLGVACGPTEPLICRLGADPVPLFDTLICRFGTELWEPVESGCGPLPALRLAARTADYRLRARKMPSSRYRDRAVADGNARLRAASSDVLRPRPVNAEDRLRAHVIFARTGWTLGRPGFSAERLLSFIIFRTSFQRIRRASISLSVSEASEAVCPLWSGDD